jgi:hypothetical protein
MSQIITQVGSEYNQTSFSGGMNLLLDDTRLSANQYRAGFNLRNRYDALDEIQESILDTTLPEGIIQDLVAFGNYVIVFVSGRAYYRLYDSIAWTRIQGFGMSNTAPRLWTAAIPVATTRYGRISSSVSDTISSADSLGNVQQVQTLAATFAGNLPGLLVQDNVSQPQFIYLDGGYNIQCRTTLTYGRWTATYDANYNLIVDNREYVPIGNAMALVDGILYVVSPTADTIYRSVSGRPLDFMVNVTTEGKPGGDATTTSYSVGVGGITCLRAMSDGSLFVAASNANFAVSKNMTQNAPKMWGEYTFIRKYLFEGTCVSDRAIFDSLGDTRFIDLGGVRSFNAVAQLQNEGRNSVFTATIARAFSGINQSAGTCAAILFNNYELYGINTVFGPAIAVYDTINQCWSAFDLSQTGGSNIKAFAKVELAANALFAVTEDNKLYRLYASNTYATASVLTLSISANTLYANQNIKMNNARLEVKPKTFRCILNKILTETSVSLTTFVDNQMSVNTPKMTKTVSYVAPAVAYVGDPPLLDINTQLTNALFTLPNVEQGWKCAFLLSWNAGASVTQFSVALRDETPMNPLRTQASTI